MTLHRLLPLVLVAACAGPRVPPPVSHAEPPPTEPEVTELDGAVEDEDLSDEWWLEPPWAGFHGWTRQATWTAPTGERFVLETAETSPGEVSLIARGAGGTTVLATHSGYAEGFDDLSEVAVLPDGTVGFHADQTIDGEGSSTLYVLRWDPTSQRLITDSELTGTVHAP
jgi:hypothetical protein